MAEQLYMLEIFIDKVGVYIPDDDPENYAEKNFIIKVQFGPKVQFIIKEGQMAACARDDDMVQCDMDGYRKYTRTIRVGKSYLFPTYSDTVLLILAKFPLEIEVWTDDEFEKQEFIGVGNMHWDTGFFFYLKETVDTCKLHQPLSMKQVVSLKAECCCRRIGEVSFIMRLSALGDSIITEFQQLMDTDPNSFLFRTNKAPSMFKASRVDGDDPYFVMTGSLYETATLEDPDVIANANKKIDVCTELQSCGVTSEGTNPRCLHGNEADSEAPEKYPIDKIRMGDITGPCGNANCPLAHKIRTYMRNLYAYKKETMNQEFPDKPGDVTKKVCGQCGCKDNRWHREKCPENGAKPVCKGCGGIAQTGETCDDRIKKLHGTGVTPKSSKHQINYLTSIERDPELLKSVFGHDFVVNSCDISYPSKFATTCSCNADQPEESLFGMDFIVNPCELKYPPAMYVPPAKKCKCKSNQPTHQFGGSSKPKTATYETKIYNAEVKTRAEAEKQVADNFCLDIPDEKDRDCKCSPPKPTPPCSTFDCECLTEAQNIDSRKRHKPFCPSYKHKDSCPVTMMNNEEENNEFEEDEAEPLPYGLPPIQLGPCPVLGRPCSVPDGFARMYRAAVQPTQPPSYSEAGKVCCSKEYERIKKAIKEYAQNQKPDDFRCLHKFNVDTERRCCDKEQRLLALMGKSCCGEHKMAIQDEYKERFEREDGEKRRNQ